jgi:hypothetical protein
LLVSLTLRAIVSLFQRCGPQACHGDVLVTSRASSGLNPEVPGGKADHDSRSSCMEACGMGLSYGGILAVHRGEVAEPGLRRTPGERVFSKGNRGFKSPPLRHANRLIRFNFR